MADAHIGELSVVELGQQAAGSHPLEAVREPPEQPSETGESNIRAGCVGSNIQ